jgi:hypothetical protein
VRDRRVDCLLPCAVRMWREASFRRGLLYPEGSIQSIF